MIKRFLTTTALFTMVTQNAIAVNGPNLGITSAVLQALENPARSSINKVESLFAQKQGEALSVVRNLADSSVGAAGGINAYIESIKVNPNYVIKMTLRGVTDSKTASHKDGTTGASSALNAVPKILHGTSFYLVPIFTKGTTARNNAITSWECVTNADEVVNRFVGEKAPTDGDLSYINRYTQSPYLSHCVYASNATLTNLNGSF